MNQNYWINRATTIAIVILLVFIVLLFGLCIYGLL